MKAKLRVQHRSLGKGLRALIPEDPFLEDTGQVIDIPIARIQSNPFQPRRDFPSESLRELKESIERDGILQPLVIRPKGKGYQLVIGERRLRAAKMAGLERIPAKVLRDLDDHRMLELALVENLQREDLNPIEVAEGLNDLTNRFHLTQEQVAEKVGKQRATVTNLLRLLKLPKEIQDSVRSGELSMGHARTLLSVENAALQRTLFHRALSRKLSVRRLEQLVRFATSESKSRRPPKSGSTAISRAEDHLRTLLGTQVRIRNRSQGGTIEIEYYSEDDLERLLELFDAIEKQE
jgi:ParB family chromosome partitioning protein